MKLGFLIGGALAAAIVLSACAGGSSAQVEQGRTLSRHGLTIALPEGWDGRIRRFSPDTAPVLHAANFVLPSRDNSVGTHAQKLLRPGRVLVVVTDLGQPGTHLQNARWVRSACPISVRPRDRGAFKGFEVPALATRWLIVRRHALLVQVAFGEKEPPPRAWSRANAALARFSVGADC